MSFMKPEAYCYLLLCRCTFCPELASVPLILSNIVALAQRLCIIGAEAIVVAVTIYYAYGTMKAARQINMQVSFSSVLVRAGKAILVHGEAHRD